MIDPSRRDALRAGAGITLAMALPAHATATAPDDTMLWYDTPASEWTQALPIGSGRLGGMVFGGIANERIQLNEDTFFSGSPHDSVNPKAGDGLPRVRQLVWEEHYKEAQALADEVVVGQPARQMAYQPIGDLLLIFPGVEGAQDYRRSLDLDGAVARTRFKMRAVTHLREVFASAPDRVIAMRLATDAPKGSVTVTIGLSSPQESEITIEDGDTIVLRGIGPKDRGVPGGIRFETRVQVRRRGGEQITGHDGIRIEDADEVLLLIATATSYRRFDDIGGDPSAIAKADIAAVVTKSWDALRTAHQADHRALFRRVSIDLGRTPAADLPTDQRIARSGALDDPALAALYYQYGRYLLIASSRPGTQPANLQGIWNERTTPPWGSKWTLNINAEMNYWLADAANLGDLVEPLLRMTEDLAVTGQRVAHNNWGARGWVAYHNTDLFRQATVTDSANSGMWPMGGAWLLNTLWDHWDYSRDRAFLARLYPLMASSCRFYLDALAAHPRTGEWVMNPSNSPENAHHAGVTICAGPALDSQLLRDLFARTVAMSELLGRDPDLRADILAKRSKLPPDRIGQAGQLQEWFEDWDMDAPEINHRHVSHLYALYPSDQISPQRTPDLARAAQRSLEIRGDNATGWGLAWRLNLWARLGQREHAHAVLKMLLDPGRTYPNMFDAHPPFQIDGNLGGASGIGQMLLQSHSGAIHLLPALARSWPGGSVTGLRARGGIEVDLRWAAGRLVEAVLRANAGGPATVRYDNKEITVPLRAGARVRIAPTPDGLAVL